jgi:phage-related protein
MRQIIFYRLENGKCPIEDYLDSLSDKQTEKVFFVLELLENITSPPSKFFKKLAATDDIWEVRVQYENNIFRLFGFLDGHDLIILNHAFTKKTQKAPKKEIKIAEQRKKDYFLKRSMS